MQKLVILKLRKGFFRARMVEAEREEDNRKED
jgi:hypothetical protein